jgi:hypothetical protein
MLRCSQITELGVYHVKRNGGNTISNAIVLSVDCHKETELYKLYCYRKKDLLNYKYYQLIYKVLVSLKTN